MACSPAQAGPKFKASEVVGRSSELMICDLDGDGLKDLVLMDDLNLSIFYQDRTQGFTREPQQTYRLEHRPCVVWAAKLGRQAESLLVMTSDGVTELCFTNQTGPPALRQIIRQPTIVPEARGRHQRGMPSLVGGDRPRLAAAAGAGGGRTSGLATSRGVASGASHRPCPLMPACGRHVADPGYDTSLGLDLSVGDVNGDGRDDLMVRRSQIGRTNTLQPLPSADQWPVRPGTGVNLHGQGGTVSHGFAGPI